MNFLPTLSAKGVINSAPYAIKAMAEMSKSPIQTFVGASSTD
ncbi:hypothetical protein [Pseudoalteromonas sp. C2R02]|nr:hypothetical protein [Pseudoalteromonas sp. C2R02]